MNDLLEKSHTQKDLIDFVFDLNNMKIVSKEEKTNLDVYITINKDGIPCINLKEY